MILMDLSELSLMEWYGVIAILWTVFVMIYLTSHKKWPELMGDVESIRKRAGVTYWSISIGLLFAIFIISAISGVVWPINMVFFTKARLKERKANEQDKN